MNRTLPLLMVSKLIIFIDCSVKDSENVFMHSSTLNTSCLLSIISNVHILDIVYPLIICSRTFVVGNFTGFSLNPSTSLIKDQRSS